MNLKILYKNTILENVYNGHLDPKLIFMTDETWFYLNGHVSSSYVRYWNVELQVPLHSDKVGVWCATDEENQYGYFQKDNAEGSMDIIKEVFGDRIINRGHGGRQGSEMFKVPPVLTTGINDSRDVSSFSSVFIPKEKLLVLISDGGFKVNPKTIVRPEGWING
ncbi:hypothetical protein ANN_04662 [Periplaneta americana]|uniref:Uncharacterized protein n=1 Tax=Periplaneta americana TaxID=6978 RepID=A0ABQ8TB24_PERAM|nr:hypothetical protein ANN_04662 [Periplaneta americana]